MFRALLIAAVALVVIAAPAAAEDNYLELWLNPVLAKEFDDRNFAEIETQQRLRGGPADDQYVGRLWLGRKLGGGTSLMVGVHRGFEGDTRETRLMQQLGYRLVGPLRGRTRLEQRIIEGDDRTGWRLRQRVGIGVPLTGGDEGWSLNVNAEGFFTLRATSAGGTTGLTALRTFAGAGREFGPLALELGYTRQQNIRRGAPDRVGHAPTIAVTFTL